MTVKEIGMDQVTLLPPKPGTCPECAAAHGPAWPHNKDSLYYQMRFYQAHKRFPTWADAMAHCSEPVKKAWKEELAARGVSQEQLEEHGQERVDSL